MGDNFIGYFRRVTTGGLKVNGECRIGEKSIIAGTGKTFYVDSDASNTSDTNDGRSWIRPLATLDAAINKCTANQGDVILLAEGHAESWTTTGAKFTADVAGITIIGLGEGSNRATFSFGHTGTTVTISAANVTIENCLFVTAIDSVVTYGTISGTDCKLINCEMRDTTDKEVISDWTVTGDRFKAIGCFKNGYTGGNANARVFSLNGVDNALFEDCIFRTKVTTGIINLVSNACTNVVAKNTVFYVNGTTDGSKNIVDTVTGSTYIYLGCGDLSVGTISTGNISTVTDALYGATGIATFPASAAPANNVSLAEVLRDVWDSLRNGTGGSEPGTNLSIVDELKRGMVHYNNPNYLAVTIDLTSATFNTVATHELFTVTGLVRMRVIAEVTTTGDDTSGNTSTIQLGTEDATNDWIAATEVDDLTVGEIWADATPTETNGNYSSLVFDKVVNGVDVGYEIAGEAATDGVIVFHCVWEPLNATGAVVAGDGSAMV